MTLEQKYLYEAFVPVCAVMYVDVGVYGFVLVLQRSNFHCFN